MNTMKWLIKRELWEHKGGFVWAPSVIGAIMTLFIAASLLAASVLGSKPGLHNGAQVSNISASLTTEQKTEFVAALANGYMGTSAPLFMVLAFVVFFFCLGALFDERKDRSVLFWKSLPVSDSATVLSKTLMALTVAPLLTLGIATIAAIASLLLICSAAAALGLNVFGEVFGTPAVYLAPLQMTALIPVYMLWALPTVGWLLMVSAWARTKPFLWAVGAPALTGALLSWFNLLFNFHWNIAWFWKNIVGRGLLSIVPGSWFTFADIEVAPGAWLTGSEVGNGMAVSHGGMHLGAILVQSWQALATANLWIGAAAGTLMIFAAIRLRRWRDEG
jgi:ABC-2 type transport system permease protein